MNIFIASVDGRTVATVSDDVLRQSLVTDLVVACLRSGCSVEYADDAISVATISTPAPKPKLIAAPKPKRTYKRRQAAQKKTIKPIKPKSAAEFNTGDRI